MAVLAAVLFATGVPAAVCAADSTAARIAALAAEAKALKARGDRPAALARAEAAVALAESDPGRNDANLYAALDLLTAHVPDTDFERQFAVFDRAVPVAARAIGPDSFEAIKVRAGRDILAFFLRKPGATIAAISEGLDRALPLAVSENDRAQTAGWAMVLAQLYDSTGDHARAVALVARVAPFYDSPPAVPNETFGASLATLAQRYATWQDWPRAMDAADRAIAATIAYYGGRTVQLDTALRVRGQGHVALGRYAEAERDFREAVALADSDSNRFTRAGAMLNLARFYVMTGRDSLALPMLERVAEESRTFPAQSNTRIVTLIELYNAAMRAGDGAAALRHAVAAREDADTRGQRNGPNYLTILLGIANASIAAGRPDEAARTLGQVEALLPSAVQPNSPRYADVQAARGKLAEDRGDRAESVRRYRAAVERWQAVPGGDPLQLVQLRSRLAAGLLRAGDAREAWAAARMSGDALVRIAAMRVGSGNPQPLDAATLAVFDTTLDTAWGLNHPR